MWAHSSFHSMCKFECFLDLFFFGMEIFSNHSTSIAIVIYRYVFDVSACYFFPSKRKIKVHDTWNVDWKSSADVPHTIILANNLLFLRIFMPCALEIDVNILVISTHCCLFVTKPVRVSTSSCKHADRRTNATLILCMVRLEQTDNYNLDW